MKISGSDMAETGQVKTAEKKRRRKMGLFPFFLLAVFLLSLGACLYLLCGEVSRETGIRDMEEDIRTFVRPAEPENKEATVPDESSNAANTEYQNVDIIAEHETDAYVFDWEGMLARSDYVIGWIQIPGIERINYPIVQHPDDNQFFLTHDWTGEPQSAGAIFVNRYNLSDFTDMNTVIYGHRMKSGSMFGSLKKYGDQSFMDENPYFHIYTPDGIKRTYEIVCYTPVTDGSDAYLMWFNSPAERMAYYEMMLHNATAKRDVELGKFDTTVILSTCSTTGYYDRLVLLGRLVAIDLEGQPEDWYSD